MTATGLHVGGGHGNWGYCDHDCQEIPPDEPHTETTKAQTDIILARGKFSTESPTTTSTASPRRRRPSRRRRPRPASKINVKKSDAVDFGPNVVVTSEPPAKGIHVTPKGEFGPTVSQPHDESLPSNKGLKVPSSESGLWLPGEIFFSNSLLKWMDS